MNTVSDELINEPQPSPEEEDVNTTPPNPAQSSGEAGWTMPDPVFRKTSGYLPQGYEKKFSQEEIKSEVDDDSSTASMPRPVGLTDVDVEPQPEIADHHEEPVATATPPTAKKGGAMKVVFSLFGILVALGLLLVFIALIYYLFFMPSAANGTFGMQITR